MSGGRSSDNGLSARRILALHGFSGSPEAIKPVLAGLPSPAWEVLAPSLVGHGVPPQQGSDSFAGEVTLLTERAAQLERPVLLGYSMGARLALGMLCAAPELYSGAVLIGVSPGLSDSERRQRRQREAGWQQLLEAEGLEAFINHFENLPVFSNQRELSPETLRRQRRQRLSHTAAGLSRALGTLGLGVMPDLLPELPHVSVPVLLLTGERDEKFSELARQMGERLPQGRHRVIPGAGHNLLLEAPGEVIDAVQSLSAD